MPTRTFLGMPPSQWPTLSQWPNEVTIYYYNDNGTKKIVKETNAVLQPGVQYYIEGVTALGQALKLEIVATGVASPSDAEFLRANGCAALQGPIAPQATAAADCEAMLRRQS